MNSLVERIKATKTTLIILISSFLVFTILVIFLVDDFVHDVILVPIAYYIWLGKIIIGALPQKCFIIALVIAGITIILPSLRRSRRRIWTARQSVENIRGQVSVWEERLRLLTKGNYSDTRFAYHLGHLVVQILAYEERLPIRDTINAIENGSFATMPEDVRAYVLNGIGMGNVPKLTFGQRLQLLWRRLIPSVETQNITKNSVILSVLAYIEEKLNVIDPPDDN